MLFCSSSFGIHCVTHSHTTNSVESTTHWSAHDEKETGVQIKQQQRQGTQDKKRDDNNNKRCKSGASNILFEARRKRAKGGKKTRNSIEQNIEKRNERKCGKITKKPLKSENIYLKK